MLSQYTKVDRRTGQKDWDNIYTRKRVDENIWAGLHRGQKMVSKNLAFWWDVNLGDMWQFGGPQPSTVRAY